MRYDIFANWEINTICNFKCKYCINQNDKQDGYNGYCINDIINGFDRIGKTFLIHMSGGEPFLQPSFVELCEELTKKHYISINTNLSTKNVYDFAEKIAPKKVEFIHCSLHIDERERKNLVQDFIEKYHCLEDAGFEIFATQVLYPPILEKFGEYSDRLKENGIILKPKIFRGYYRHARYPHGYSKDERDEIIKYIETSIEIDNSTNRYCMIEQLLEKEFSIYGDLSFRGLLCRAGIDFVVINHDGDIWRCHGEQAKIGNIFEGYIDFLKEPKPCPVKICPCPFFGLIETDAKPKIVEVDMVDIIKDKAISICRTVLK